MRQILLACVLTALLSSAALADDMTLTKAASPVAHDFGGHQVDVLGIKLGMTPDEARPILQQYCGEQAPNETQARLGISYNSVTVSSQPFLAQMRCQKSEGWVDVFFGNPTIGGVVIAMDRQLNFLDEKTAPPMTGLSSTLVAKYGAVSDPQQRQFGGNASTAFFWVYEDAQARPCPNDMCPTIFGDPQLEANSAPEQLADGIQASVQATVGRASDDASRASYLQLVVVDQRNLVLAAKTANEQLTAAAKTDYKKEAVAQMPKL